MEDDRTVLYEVFVVDVGMVDVLQRVHCPLDKEGTFVVEEVWIWRFSQAEGVSGQVLENYPTQI